MPKTVRGQRGRSGISSHGSRRPDATSVQPSGGGRGDCDFDSCGHSLASCSEGKAAGAALQSQVRAPSYFMFCASLGVLDILFT
jgi:hypothetical protein